MTFSGRAWRSGDDPGELARKVNLAHDRFLTTGRTGLDVRPLVADSWQRCLELGLDPEAALAPVDLVDAALDEWRLAHPLAGVMPVIRRLLVDDAADAGLLVAVTDAAGRLLWVEGPAGLRSRAEGMHFVAGATWSESVAGTNAPGTALAIGQPVQIFAAEHLSRRVTPWSCSAAPIRDPDTGAVLGALDLTGGNDVAAPHTLSLVRATIAAVESELRLQRLYAAAPHQPWGTSPQESTRSDTYLQVLGHASGVLQTPHTASRLSLRHSELLVLLADHPDGLSGDELAVALHDYDLAAVTLRAELSRLRPLLAPIQLASRPYRLDGPLPSDAADVRRLLSRGEVGQAVAAYRGPLLPRSEAPGIVRSRDELHDQLRGALLRSGDPDALLRFADTDHGRLDWSVWEAARQTLPAASPRREQVERHLAYLASELA